jgi:hypothetical protein
VGFVADIKVSAVPDLRAIPLAVITALTPVSLDTALQRVVPDTLIAPVAVAAFSSSI